MASRALYTRKIGPSAPVELDDFFAAVSAECYNESAVASFVCDVRSLQGSSEIRCDILRSEVEQCLI